MADQPLNLTDYIRDVPDFPKPGILFRDITPLLSHPEAFAQVVAQLSEQFADAKIDVVAAAEARGFIFAGPVAMNLGASLVPIRKAGKLPFTTVAYTYDLEYGSDTLEIHIDAIPAGARVLVLDDLLATGGTIEACCHLVEKAGGKVAACAFVVELTRLEGARRITDYEKVSLIQYD